MLRRRVKTKAVRDKRTAAPGELFADGSHLEHVGGEAVTDAELRLSTAAVPVTPGHAARDPRRHARRLRRHADT